MTTDRKEPTMTTTTQMTDAQLANEICRTDETGEENAELVNEVVTRLEIDPDETEQGLTDAAAAAVADFIDRHATV